MKSNVTAVLTSCGRFEALKKTIDSFFLYNTYPLEKFILIDDLGKDPSSVKEIIDTILEPYKDRTNFQIIINNVNIGQVKSIDLAYSYVDTNYIFHIEDDWEFYNKGFIEDSISILERYPWIVVPWLRAFNDTNGHPIQFINALGFPLVALDFLGSWHGFTWNPGLRRLSDYQLLGRFSENAPSESLASEWYFKRGYRACVLKEDGYVRHIGYHISTFYMPGTQKG